MNNRILDFSASVNPLGPPRAVIDAAKSVLEEVDRYPDPFAAELTKAISVFEDVPEEYILCGSGASEIIYSYCAALKPQTIIEVAPTFSEYAEAAELHGAKVMRYFCKEENEFLPGDDFFDFICKAAQESSSRQCKEADVAAVDANNTAIFICNPNNPTGRLLTKEFIGKVLDVAGGAYVFIDECFMDLSDAQWSSKEFLKNHPNLFILKACTKTFAVPGLRLGYGLCSDSSLLKKMSVVVPPWNISSVAQAAGIAALKEGAYIEEAKALIKTEREKLSAALGERGCKVIPSEANFVLFKRRGADEVDLSSCVTADKENCESGHQAFPELLKQKGIAIRNCENFPGLGEGWYRVAVRKSEENQKLIDAINAAD